MSKVMEYIMGNLVFTSWCEHLEVIEPGIDDLTTLKEIIEAEILEKSVTAKAPECGETMEDYEQSNLIKETEP